MGDPRDASQSTLSKMGISQQTHLIDADRQSLLTRMAVEPLEEASARGSSALKVTLLMKLFINMGSPVRRHLFACRGWVLLSARQGIDINIFISLTLGGQLGLLQMTYP